MSDPASIPDEGHTRPGWVKVLGVAAVVVIVVVVVIALAGGGHGPSRHLPGGDDAPAEHTPPPGGHD